MQQIRTFSDDRLNLYCTYCGKRYPDTRDHVPAKVLLDEPYPDNLPVVQCCTKCNNGFSLDEEYFACLLECAICGTVEVSKLKRDKIKKILSHKESLRIKLEMDKSEINGQVVFKVDVDRMKSVLLKLAKGHVKFEHSESIYEEPHYFFAKPLAMMSENEVHNFFILEEINKISEVGSRGFSKLLIVNNIPQSYWEYVQENSYRYYTNCNSGVCVKIILREYFAVEMRWN